jgi:hypothetical protein
MFQPSMNKLATKRGLKAHGCILPPIFSSYIITNDKLRLRNTIYGKLRLAFETSDIRRDFQEFYERYGTLFLDELALAEVTEAGRKLVEGSANPSAATATGKAKGSSASTEVLLAQSDPKAKKVKKAQSTRGRGRLVLFAAIFILSSATFRSTRMPIIRGCRGRSPQMV